MSNNNLNLKVLSLIDFITKYLHLLMISHFKQIISCQQSNNFIGQKCFLATHFS